MSQPTVATLFEDPDLWQVFASGQAQGKLSRVTAADGSFGLQLEYDFHGGGGFVVIRRVVHFTMPETFEIGFQMRGEGPPNHFEFKVADPGGSNVWRNLSQDFKLPESWTEYRFNERNLPFAWGPAGGGPPSEIEAVEFVIAAGPGGKGTLQLSQPTFEDQTLRSPQLIRASSEQVGCPAEAVFAAGSLAVWKAAFDDATPWWMIDFGRSLRFGGLIIQWPENLPPRAFVVEASDDGAAWVEIHRAESAQGLKSHISTPGAEARQLRILFANSACAALNSLTIRPDAYSRTQNQFIHNVAADFPRGWFPRYWLREQSYWTPVGSPGGKRR
ncbi:MAG TPA: discoidin domain-containing protein, partial [Luteolibacter sp.]